MAKSRRSIRKIRNKKVTGIEFNNKLVIVLLLFIIIFFGFIYSIKHIKIERTIIKDDQSFIEQKNEEIAEDNQKGKTIATISAVGDILCSEKLMKSCKTQEGYDFSNVFKNVRQKFEKSNIVIGCFETSITQNAYSGNKKYNVPAKFADDIKASGINMVSIAHNHSLDYGKEGFMRTKEYLENIEIQTIGTSNENQINYVIKDCNGIKVAVLAYTDIIENKKDENEYKCLNIYSEEKVKIDVEDAKKNSEFVIVYMHWGDVGKNGVNSKQEQIAKYLKNLGVNVILGSHPPIIQKVEMIDNVNGNKTFVAYSLGNYIAGYQEESANVQILIDIQLEKNFETGKTVLKEVQYTPLYMIDNELIDMRDILLKYQNKEVELKESKYKKILRLYEEVERILQIKK